MCTKNQNGALRNMLQLVNEDYATRFEIFNNIGIVNDFMSNIYGSTINSESLLNYQNSPFNSGTKTAGLS
jgi:hypothetical protein